MVLLTMVLTKYVLIDSVLFNIGHTLSNIQFFYLSISVLCITAGGYIVNDIYDVETDNINKPNKVFINTTITKNNAWKVYVLLTFLGLLLGALMAFKLVHFTYFLVPTLLLFLYSKYLKHYLLIGNIVIALLISFVIFLVYEYYFITQCCYQFSEFDKPLRKIIVIYMFFSFITTLIREIIKDIEDVDGDLKANSKTLPIVIGRKRASKVVFFITCMLFIFLLIILQYLKKDPLFLTYGVLSILLPLLYFMYKLWFAKRKKDFSKLSLLMKLIMFFGILSMLLFKFI